MSGLVLSLFPGIGLLDMAFEEEGFCVVRGPDLLWGGDVHRFHPPAGRFDGVIGGPPCQEFSQLSAAAKARGRGNQQNLIPEFERVVGEARPAWFLMENVRQAPVPGVAGYRVSASLVNNRNDAGGEQHRVRRFSFGSIDGRPLALDWWKPAIPSRRLPTATCHATTWDPVRQRSWGEHTRKGYERVRDAQGLPDTFELPPFTVAAALRAVGNGVPIPLGRVVACAVKRAIAGSFLAAEAGR